MGRRYAHRVTSLHPFLFGVNWMDPDWIFVHYKTEFFWVCLIIVFIECGLLFPILPGDTLLFAIGLFTSGSSTHHLDINVLVAIAALSVAAFLGNVVGYEIGRWIGPPLYERDGRILKRAYFDQTREFFDLHGNIALVLGRFVPIVRTYVTVVAGVTRMDRRRFFTWSAVGAVLWVTVVTLLGYFLGAAFPSLADNLDKVIIVLALFSLIPVVWEWRKHRRARAAS
jgi:membrane-associated protein